MGRTAKYQQVTDWVREQIASGTLKSGDKLASENELSAAFGISRQTVRHAFGLLIQEGILTSVQGSGTYVTLKEPMSQRADNLSRTVTIITTYVDGYIFPRILQSMVRTLEKAGYSAKVMFTNDHLETERRLLERLLEDGSRDPLIAESVMSGLPNPNLSYYKRLQATGVPILFFHSYYPQLAIPHISMKDDQAGRIATEYLIAQGHTRIGGIFKMDDGQGVRRYTGYLEGLRQAGIGVKEEWVSWIDSQELRDAFTLSPRIMKRLSSCTACVCYNDEVAHVLTKICQEQGIRIPEDLSLVSIDNSELAALNPVPLTSVAHPMEALGKKTAEHMLRLIADPKFDATYEFDLELEERSSVCPPKKDSSGR